MSLTHCGFCGTPGPRWAGGLYCGPECQDKLVEAVIAREMHLASAADGAPVKRGRKPNRNRPRRWCGWCGSELNPSTNRRFCGPTCREECRADIAASSGAIA